MRMRDERDGEKKQRKRNCSLTYIHGINRLKTEPAQKRIEMAKESSNIQREKESEEKTTAGKLTAFI